MDLDLSSEITEIVRGEVGSDATLTTASPSGSSSVRLLLDRSYAPQGVGDDVNWSSYEFVARGLATDFTNAKQNDTLLIDGVTYTIEDKYVNIDGWAIMPLTVPNS